MRDEVDCVVVGGGPGGAMLAYLLARAGTSVALLESRGDFSRRFRGDTLSPSALELLDALGLADRMLATIPHSTADRFDWRTNDKVHTLASYRGVSAKYPYYALIPQGSFLPFLVDSARDYDGFSVRMGARVNDVLRDDDGRVKGVAWTDGDGERRLRARLVVAADGRNSKVRSLGGFRATELGASLDILWWETTRSPSDPPLSGLQLLSDRTGPIAVLDQRDRWQIGFMIPAGTFPAMRAAGVAPLRDAARRVLPWLGARSDDLTTLNDLTLLPVRITSVDTWYRPGLQLIGDAAHVISPVGGNGINYALGDAVVLAGEVAPVLLRRGSDEAVDRACRKVEDTMRPVLDREQRSQVRIERGTAARIRAGKSGPPLPFTLLAAIPGAPALFGRWGSRASRVPSPSPALVGTVRAR